MDRKASCHRLLNTGTVTSELRHYCSYPFSRLGRYLVHPVSLVQAPVEREYAPVASLTGTERKEKSYFSDCDTASGFKQHDSVFFWVVPKTSSDNLDA